MGDHYIGSIGAGSTSIVANGDLNTWNDGGKKGFSTTGRSITINGVEVTLAPGEERETGGYQLRGTDEGIEGEQL